MRTKFGFSSDQSVRFVDNSDGAEVEEDVMAELLTAAGGTVELMVLLENEDWGVGKLPKNYLGKITKLFHSNI